MADVLRFLLIDARNQLRDRRPCFSRRFREPLYVRAPNFFPFLVHGHLVYPRIEVYEFQFVGQPFPEDIVLVTAHHALHQHHGVLGFYFFQQNVCQEHRFGWFSPTTAEPTGKKVGELFLFRDVLFLLRCSKSSRPAAA